MLKGRREGRQNLTKKEGIQLPKRTSLSKTSIKKRGILSKYDTRQVERTLEKLGLSKAECKKIKDRYLAAYIAQLSSTTANDKLKEPNAETAKKDF